jgi:eukaryotic-like serine/threonine-protein kinase
MSHGHVEAASVLATEQAVKLRSDCLHISATGQAEDVAGIGATLFHAFTQRKALTATDAQINRIPAPFAEIVRNSFARRWNLAQIANALKPGLPSTATVPPLPPVPPPAQAPLQFEPTAETVPEKAPPVAYRRAAPSIPVAKSVPVVTEEDATGQKSTPTRPRRALYVAAAVCVLAIVGWLLLRPHSTTPETASSAQPVTQAPEPTPPIAMKPLAVKPAPPPHQPRPVTSAPVATPSSGRTVWRVVVYTYKGQTKAADALAKISGKYPDLDASVFNPRGSDVYMVVLGGAMDRSHAISMLDKARSKGVPPDTYIRNFSE